MYICIYLAKIWISEFQILNPEFQMISFRNQFAVDMSECRCM